jgi:hypothetical protein
MGALKYIIFLNVFPVQKEYNYENRASQTILILIKSILNSINIYVSK